MKPAHVVMSIARDLNGPSIRVEARETDDGAVVYTLSQGDRRCAVLPRPGYVLIDGTGFGVPRDLKQATAEAADALGVSWGPPAPWYVSFTPLRMLPVYRRRYFR